jgi:hypothetical protein
LADTNKDELYETFIFIRLITATAQVPCLSNNIRVRRNQPLTDLRNNIRDNIYNWRTEWIMAFLETDIKWFEVFHYSYVWVFSYAFGFQQPIFLVLDPKHCARSVNRFRSKIWRRGKPIWEQQWLQDIWVLERLNGFVLFLFLVFNRR